MFIIGGLNCFMNVVVVAELYMGGSLLNLLEFGLAIAITVVGVELKKGLLDLLQCQLGHAVWVVLVKVNDHLTSISGLGRRG